MQNGFMTITAMRNILGWRVWPLIYGCVSILMGMASPSRKMIHDRIANTHIISVAGTEK